MHVTVMMADKFGVEHRIGTGKFEAGDADIEEVIVAMLLLENSVGKLGDSFDNGVLQLLHILKIHINWRD